MIIRARAPLRISFAGGGTDVAPYFSHKSGAVISATIDKYAFASLEPRPDDEVSIRSLDYDMTVQFDLNEAPVYDGQLDLAKGVIRHFQSQGLLTTGADIYLHNDAPPGSGLGSSSALTVALIEALSQFVRVPLGPYETADLAYKVERLDVGIKGGKQDQFACTFGGLNFIEFMADATVVNPLRLKADLICELEYSLLLAYIGGVHFSSHIIERQMARYAAQDSDAVFAFDELKRIAFETKKALLLGRLREFGGLLDSAWHHKRRLASEISNPRIDEIYEHAKKAGALGGKLSGAGGGGFMFFFCDPRKRFSVQDALKQVGAETVGFSFTQEGVRSWTVEQP